VLLSVRLRHRFLTVLSYALLVVSFSTVGCKHSTSVRPENVPAAAVWADSAFVECSVEVEANANKCTVRDAHGTLLESGLYILNVDGRAANKTELKYAAFREGIIYLEGNLFLYPVLPLEPDRSVIDNKLQLLAGRGVSPAVDCGRIAVHQNANPASECALNALLKKKPFHVRFDLQGYEGIYSFGLAGDGRENVYTIEDDSLLQDMHTAAGTRVGVTPCPKPIKTRISPGGIPTCLSTDP
jgi:hypothetical protein